MAAEFESGSDPSHCFADLFQPDVVLNQLLQTPEFWDWTSITMAHDLSVFSSLTSSLHPSAPDTSTEGSPLNCDCTLYELDLLSGLFFQREAEGLHADFYSMCA
ncbi:hypothetical protein CVT26_006391 [Gymnopilus dilepis]|uniref:Uncharacterized protein n=1 Tax=Gymnopilus dilepis TaxID=231916 RepID=A0A409Y0K9_9AGAR|nr:hypothetical protein CVT26_006391 [Gymnopilus dilepis]